MGIFKKLFKDKKKTDDELKVDVLKKATAHLSAHSDEGKSFQGQGTDVNKVGGSADLGSDDAVVEKPYISPQNIDQAKKKNIRAVLLEIADRGEAGVLLMSISDKTEINQQETATALDYLTRQNYVEAINSPSGMKCYLTDAGRKFCASKEFNTDF